ncbi:MAG: hypothetical protein V1737_04555 [Chloroflexota bacterium]
MASECYPRAEVSMMVAGVGLTRGLIKPGVFGVTVMLIIVSTVFTAVVLSVLFRNDKEGRSVPDWSRRRPWLSAW